MVLRVYDSGRDQSLNEAIIVATFLVESCSLLVRVLIVSDEVAHNENENRIITIRVPLHFLRNLDRYPIEISMVIE